ncbi:basic blue protein-like [Neltuma alba]|uniref:basic blue protein-like n=1 Tax=Neltuma alba TaxID=207710 RepID=UPI0010A2A987|nr:basic blue protein-like [Prosopis alba]
MGNYWGLRVILISMVVVVVPIMAAMGDPMLHKLYEWSAHEQFFLGDWLLFNFDKRYFNVLEVNETSYENCRDEGFVKNLTRGGRDVVQLTEARTHYYLSSGGYCFQGMKVAVTVQHGHREAAPAPSPSHSSASSAFSMGYCPFIQDNESNRKEELVSVRDPRALTFSLFRGWRPGGAIKVYAPTFTAQAHDGKRSSR